MHSRDAHDVEIMRQAEYFTACRFLGRRRYDTRRCNSLEEARVVAHTMGGVVMIYAVKGVMQAHVENIENVEKA